MNKDIEAYNAKHSEEVREIFNILAEQNTRILPEAENKIWHAHPVWFLDGIPVVGYSKLKDNVAVIFRKLIQQAEELTLMDCLQLHQLLKPSGLAVIFNQQSARGKHCFK